MSYKITDLTAAFFVSILISGSKLFSVSGFRLKSNVVTDFEFAISSNNAFAPTSFISQLLSLNSRNYEQNGTAAETHLAPVLPIGESDISMTVSLFSIMSLR
jgi:hypothetical protein